MAESPNVTISRCYFEALVSKDFRSVPLASDVVLESPITPKLRGAESVQEFLDALASLIKRVRIINVIAQYDQVIVEFEMETGQGVIPGFQSFEFFNGQIKRLRPYFDARPLTNGAGTDGVK
jgi:hypothetical protein